MLRSGAPMPSLEGATEWLNAPEGPAAPAGRPTLVHFWAMSCGICKDHLATVEQWRDAYRSRGLQVVSVHMPRLPADLDVDAVRRTVLVSGVTDPVAIDNAHRIGDRFETGGLWPAYFLFDAAGKLRARAAGASGLQLLEATLRHLVLAA